MLMLLNLLNDVEKNPGPVLYDKIYIVYWITIYIYFNIKVIFFLHFLCLLLLRTILSYVGDWNPGPVSAS
jgi:hypothetical protein